MNSQILDRPRVTTRQSGYQVFKRLMDLILCLITLPLTLPVMGICMLLIILDSPGSPLFIQERVGRGGEIFRLFKFRTMPVDFENEAHRAFMKAFVRGEVADKDKAADGEVNDPTVAFSKAFRLPDAAAGTSIVAQTYKPVEHVRITRIGRILRKLSLDELPQIFNVIKGEMSIIGPRPNVLWEVEEYQSWHYRRLQVLPGITGLAQVKGRSGISFKRIVTYDIEYIESQCLLLDLKILWLTVAAVIGGQGAE